MTGKTEFDLDETTASTVCYIPVLGLIPAILFAVVEKNMKVKKHAVRATILGLISMVAGWLMLVSLVLAFFAPAVNLIGLIIIPLYLAVKSYQNEDVNVPILDKVTEKVMAKLKK